MSKLELAEKYFEKCQSKKLDYKSTPRFLDEELKNETEDVQYAIEIYVRYNLGDRTVKGSDLDYAKEFLKQERSDCQRKKGDIPMGKNITPDYTTLIDKNEDELREILSELNNASLRKLTRELIGAVVEYRDAAKYERELASEIRYDDDEEKSEKLSKKEVIRIVAQRLKDDTSSSRKYLTNLSNESLRETALYQNYKVSVDANEEIIKLLTGVFNIKLK